MFISIIIINAPAKLWDYWTKVHQIAGVDTDGVSVAATHDSDTSPPRWSGCCVFTDAWEYRRREVGRHVDSVAVAPRASAAAQRRRTKTQFHRRRRRQHRRHRVLPTTGRPRRLDQQYVKTLYCPSQRNHINMKASFTLRARGIGLGLGHGQDYVGFQWRFARLWFFLDY